MTASWSKGRGGKYPYYHCKTKGCELYSKSIRRDAAEKDFEDLLHSLTPSEAALDLTRAIIRDTWKDKKAEHTQLIHNLRSETKALDLKLNSLLDRICEAQNDTVIVKIPITGSSKTPTTPDSNKSPPSPQLTINPNVILFVCLSFSVMFSPFIFKIKKRPAKFLGEPDIDNHSVKMADSF